jgi:transposase
MLGFWKVLLPGTEPTKVYTDMEQWMSVRRFVLAEGRSKRSACKHFGISWRVMKKMLAHPEPPGYRTKAARPKPKLDAFLPIIHQILVEDRSAPRKQRHTAKRNFDRLRAEHGFTGGYTGIKDAVRAWRNVHQETFVPLKHAPGEAQADFGEAQVRIGGELTKVCLFVMSLPHSDAVFVMAYPRECTEAFCDGHARALEFFGGVPRVIRYDNTAIAVRKVMGGRERGLTDAFLRLQSHYLFEHQFCRVRRANEKGHVENLIGYTRRNFLVPVPSVADFAALNAMLRERCERELDRTVRGESRSKRERLAEDRVALRPMPEASYEARRVQPAMANSLSLVSFDRNHYSVPVEFAHRELTVVGTIEEVRILCRERIIATHPRDWGLREVGTRFDPVHYLALLERKPGALDTARPLEDWPLPVCFGILRRQMEGHWFGDGKRSDGTRRFIRVLRLLEHHTLGELTEAVRWALEHGCVDEDAIRLVAQGRGERAVPVFSLDGRAHLRAVHVAPPDLAAYAELTTDLSVCFDPACAIGGAA